MSLKTWFSSLLKKYIRTRGFLRAHSKVSEPLSHLGPSFPASQGLWRKNHTNSLELESAPASTAPRHPAPREVVSSHQNAACLQQF